MKAAILAGGLGTRLHPCTLVTNKHLLPVYDRPMVCHVIDTVKRAGCDRIKVIVGGPHAADVVRVLQDGREYGVSIEYGFQEGEGGIAAALALCEDFAAGGPLFVALGDNITDEDFADDAREFRDDQARHWTGAKVFFKQVPDPERFGVPAFKDDRLLYVEEKPTDPKSNFSMIGFYLFNADVFNVIRGLKPSGRDELEITDVINTYLRAGSVAWREIKGHWTDAGTFETLLSASLHAAKLLAGTKVVKRWTD